MSDSDSDLELMDPEALLQSARALRKINRTLHRSNRTWIERWRRARLVLRILHANMSPLQEDPWTLDLLAAVKRFVAPASDDEWEQLLYEAKIVHWDEFPDE